MTHRHHLGSILDPENRRHRAEMLHQMEIYLGLKEKCRRVELLKHFEGEDIRHVDLESKRGLQMLTVGVPRSVACRSVLLV